MPHQHHVMFGPFCAAFNKGADMTNTTHAVRALAPSSAAGGGGGPGGEALAALLVGEVDAPPADATAATEARHPATVRFAGAPGEAAHAYALATVPAGPTPSRGGRLAGEVSEAEQDLPSIMSATSPRRERLARTGPRSDGLARPALPPPLDPISGDFAKAATATMAAHAAAEAERHAAAANSNRAKMIGSAYAQDPSMRVDMLSTWRGADGKCGDSGHLASATWSALGRDIDWKAFNEAREVRHRAPPPSPAAHAAAPRLLPATDAIPRPPPPPSPAARAATSRYACRLPCLELVPPPRSTACTRPVPTEFECGGAVGAQVQGTVFDRPQALSVRNAQNFRSAAATIKGYHTQRLIQPDAHVLGATQPAPTQPAPTSASAASASAASADGGMAGGGGGADGGAPATGAAAASYAMQANAPPAPLSARGAAGSPRASNALYALPAASASATSGALSARLGLREVNDALRTRSVMECLVPSVGSPAFAKDADRHVRAEGWLLAQQEVERAAARERRDASAARAYDRSAQLARLNYVAEGRLSALDEARVRAHQTVARRVADLQLVSESRREMDEGKFKVVLEPPASPRWLKGSPAHLSSHWQTLQGRHADPPTRHHEPMIVSYRRAFPSAEKRGPTPPHPVWGGVHL